MADEGLEVLPQGVRDLEGQGTDPHGENHGGNQGYLEFQGERQ